MIVYAVIATDSVAARGLVNGWCLPRSGRRDILSVAITAFIFIGVIFRIIVKNFLKIFGRKEIMPIFALHFAEFIARNDDGGFV